MRIIAGNSTISRPRTGWNRGGMMVIDTAIRIITFLDESQEPEQEPNQGSYSIIANNENRNRELARLDLEVQALVNRILDMAEAWEKFLH